MLYAGIVENRNDPLKLGRCQVRIIGLHTHDKSLLPTNDLPWATLLAPSLSASLSGIGNSPVGLVEGSVVSIDFWSTDPEQQFPVITGTLHGIPQASGTIENEENDLVIGSDSESGTAVTDSSGNVWKDSSGTPLNQTSSTVKVKPASDYESVSDRCYALLKSSEALKLKSYQDQRGIWTIGYGTISVDGNPVIEGMTITKDQAENYLRNDVEKIRIPLIQSRVRALITQSMFDSMISFAYNIGVSAFSNSTFLVELNSAKYLDAAAQILVWNKITVDGVLEVSNGLTTRRKSEKDLFLADGIPTESGELQAGPVKYEGVVADSSGKNTGTSGVGFSDPSGKYPLYKNEPDSNRLARHERIRDTIVYKKETALDRKVPKAGGGTWDQSPIPYNAKYPFNQVFASESGHLLEFDDTKNSERIHLYHRSGTFTEIDANGTQVNRIIGDGYEILERNGFVHIRGALNVTVDGGSNTKVGGALNLDVTGNVVINLSNDASINTAGNLSMNVGGNFKLKAANIFMESTGVISEKAAGVVGIDGSQVHMNSGVSVVTGLGSAGSRGSVEARTFSALNVNTRGDETAKIYETPEEGDSTVFTEKRIERGETTKEVVNQEPIIEDSRTTATNDVKTVEPDTKQINSTEEFLPTFPLSANFTLGALNDRGKRKIVPQFGLTPNQIVSNLKRVSENILEPIYSVYPNLVVSSGFRRPGDVAESAKNSQHYLGEAVDIYIPGFDRKQHYEAILEIQKLIDYDQLLLEYFNNAWFHISLKGSGNRKQNFTMNKHKRVSQNGTFVYIA